MFNSSLTILDVVDRGVPNKERIPIRVESTCMLENYWIGVGIKQGTGRIFPINDNMLWLGNGMASQGDWLFVYTGTGTPIKTPMPNQNTSIYTLHWNRENVLFASSEIFPMLLSSTIQTPPSFNEVQPSNALVNALLAGAGGKE